MLYVALTVAFCVFFVVYCIILKISGRIAGISQVTIMQCVFIFVIPLVLVKTLSVILLKTVDDELTGELILLGFYTIVEISTIYRSLYGITLLRSIAFFIVSKIVAVILAAAFIAFIYSADMHGMQSWINNHILNNGSNEQVGQ
ncbi:MAG: hypothetical protein PQ612_08890 [Rickettsiales bacterium]|nr:hypothetical protein [Pseudomonadota bacterium]MDA0967303.1 hypothetical protein [Pseudomonadota bacterium]MDG4544036.1 hypothetical protein [Rickettsiales bacterium]MDG4546270.1 hypothetical protein [Rickettsiales bacterium]MDG4548360.1 hypothetical protein [Rickettsiales bacterium]